MKISNLKESIAGITYYHMRREANGKRYGYDLSFSNRAMKECRQGVAWRILRARQELMDAFQ